MSFSQGFDSLFPSPNPDKMMLEMFDTVDLLFPTIPSDENFILDKPSYQTLYKCLKNCEKAYKKSNDVFHIQEKKLLDLQNDLTKQKAQQDAREERLNRREDALKAHEQTVTQREKNAAALEANAKNRETAVITQENAMTAKEEAHRQTLTDLFHQENEQRAKLADVTTQAAAAELRRDKAEARVAEIKAWEAEIKAREILVENQKAMLEQEASYAQHRTEALTALNSTHNDIHMMLNQINEMRQSILLLGKDGINQEITLLKGSFAQNALCNLIDLLRSLNNFHTQEADSIAKQLGYILTQDFGCTRITPAPGAAFDSLTMAKQDASIPGECVESTIACGWMQGSAILKRAIIVPAKED